jgi:HlyD family secretion protein
MVKKGDKILRLANTSLLLDIMYREAELFQQSNNLRNTRLSMEQQRLLLSKELSEIQNRLQQQKRTYERYQELVKEELISRHEYELAKDEYEYLLERRKLAQESLENDMAFRQAQVESLESSLQRMENNLALAKQKLEDLTIRASVSGHLTTLNAEIGQSKSPGDRLGQIDVLEGFKVRAAIDEYYISRIEIGRTGKFELNNKSYSLVVKKRYPEVKEGRFTLDLEFNGEIPAGITRGQTLHIRLNLSDVSEALLLPRGGFFQTTGGNWVYALDDSGKTAVRRKVRLGRYNSDVYEVLEGLKPGEKVITSSYENFGDNERLILK